MIAVIDYQAGNLRSIRRALEAAGAEVIVTDDPAVVGQADAVVLPGVGHAGHCMGRLRAMSMDAAIHDAVDAGKPFLGLCVGMQLMFDAQEEGDTHGLGLLRGRVRAIDGPVKVPHMGWNRVRVAQDGPAGSAGDEDYYYFVHSFVAGDVDQTDVAATTVYGEEFPSVVARGDVWGTQFHPEKSGDAGLAFVRRFVQRVGARSGS
jgi:imidazole glycerol-phosphate synthase subunit HisH